MARDITAILSPERLAALRALFSNEALLDLARGNFATRYPPALAFITPLINHFFVGDTPMEPMIRERLIIAILASELSNTELAVHFYWGLMVGLTEAEIADTLLLVFGYSGANEFNNAIDLLERCLTALAALPDDGLDTISGVVAVSAVARNTWTPPKA